MKENECRKLLEAQKHRRQHQAYQYADNGIPEREKERVRIFEETMVKNIHKLM